MLNRFTLILFSFLSLHCTTRHIHTHEVVQLPNKPFEAVKESSQCYVDRALFANEKELKSAFVDSTAREIAGRFKMSSYEAEQKSCVTVDGTGRSVEVYMCPSNAKIKDHYCYP